MACLVVSAAGAPAAGVRAVARSAVGGWVGEALAGGSFCLSQHRSNVYALTVPASQQSAAQTASGGRNGEQQFTSQTADEPSGLFEDLQRSVRETPLPTRTPSSTTPGTSGRQSPLVLSVEGGGGGEADSKPADTATRAIVARVETRDPPLGSSGSPETPGNPPRLLVCSRAGPPTSSLPTSPQNPSPAPSTPQPSSALASSNAQRAHPQAPEGLQQASLTGSAGSTRSKPRSDRTADAEPARRIS